MLFCTLPVTFADAVERDDTSPGDGVNIAARPDAAVPVG
jgi:hypothetical protein